MSNPVLFDASCSTPAVANDEILRLAIDRAGARGLIVRLEQADQDWPVPLAGLVMSINLRKVPNVDDLVAQLSASASPSLLLLVSLHSSDAHDKAGTPRAMPAAAQCVTVIAATARSLGLQVTLAPRPGTWLEHPQDAVRLAMRVNKRHVGVALDIPAWQQTDGNANQLPDMLRLVLPKLNAVSVQMTDAANTWGTEPTTQAIFSHLRASGWRGPVVVRAAGR